MSAQRTRTNTKKQEAPTKPVPFKERFTCSRASIPHIAHPERNEDSITIDRQRGLVGVFDGVGGSARGEIASRLAAHTAQKLWRQTLNQTQSQPTLLAPNHGLNIFETLHYIIREANQGILAEGDEIARTAGRAPQSDDYAGTTAALAVFHHERKAHTYKMTYAHIGDSRIYLLRANEPLQRLTHDDGYFSLLVRRGEIDEETAWRIDQASSPHQLTRRERGYFNKRNGITQSLGDYRLVLHMNQTIIIPGDRILFCSDGIHDNLTDEEIYTTLLTGARTTVARILVQQAKERSEQEKSVCIRAKADDMSAVVVTCRE
jgi:protein phosphatase